MPPSFRIVNSGYAFDWAKENIERDSKSFVFFASSGQVHKGLFPTFERLHVVCLQWI